MVVDCLLGTGFQGALHENYRTAIEEINATDTQVISVDINSGMNGATGEHHPTAIPCPSWLDMTVIKAFSETL
jgi:NAD(P)H-hydrate repair Nnr-like enzyme with NAD(P)H-hydrate epimerase domain